MINIDEKSNGNGWELEVVCKSRKYMNAVVTAILKSGCIEFEVNTVDVSADRNDYFDGHYTVLMWSYWFHNLLPLVKDLAKIEKKFEKY